MSTHFYDVDTLLDVSRFDSDGWWQGNQQEHVAAGTALGVEFTTTLYTPSKEGVTGRYDSVSNTWSEVIDNTATPWWSQYGELCRVQKPDTPFPAEAIFTAPPKHDETTEFVIYREGKWHIKPNLLGQAYWLTDGLKRFVNDSYFILPDDGTLTPPPAPLDGHVVRLVDRTWRQVPDYRGQTAYSTLRDGRDYVILDIGDVPGGFTLEAPGHYDSWVNEAWHYDIDRERQEKERIERTWRDAELKKVLDRLNQYFNDQQLPAELRRSPLTAEQVKSLAHDRALLSDYPSEPDFPLGTRPELSCVLHSKVAS